MKFSEEVKATLWDILDEMRINASDYTVNPEKDPFWMQYDKSIYKSLHTESNAYLKTIDELWIKFYLSD